MWTKEQLAYFSGIIDGEGTIYIQKVDRKTFIDYFPRIQIINTNKDLMYWIKDTFGGIIVSRDRSNENRNWRLQYTWYTTRKLMDIILPMILPFLIIKKKQVEKMIEFRKTFINKKTYRITPEVLSIREDFMNQIRHFNNPL